MHTKIFLVAITFAFISNPDVLPAQSIVPRVAFAVSNTTYEPTSPPGEINSRRTFSAGIGLQFDLARQWDLLCEVNYVSKGHKFYSNREASYGTNVRVIYEGAYSHNYLVIPVIVRTIFSMANFGPLSVLVRTWGLALAESLRMNLEYMIVDLQTRIQGTLEKSVMAKTLPIQTMTSVGIVIRLMQGYLLEAVC